MARFPMSQADYLVIFQAICDRLQTTVGHRLFTVSHNAPGAHTAQRIFTTAPDVYPVSGVKPVDDSEWSRQMRQGRCFVASRAQDFGPHFFDLDVIVGMGLGAVINVPVLRDGRMVGSLNLLDSEGAYSGPVLDHCLAELPEALRGFAEFERQLARE